MARATRLQRAIVLLHDATLGPTFSDQTTAKDRRAAHALYRLWSRSWLLPALADLAPEVRALLALRPNSDSDWHYWGVSDAGLLNTVPEYFGTTRANIVTARNAGHVFYRLRNAEDTTP